MGSQRVDRELLSSTRHSVTRELALWSSSDFSNAYGNKHGDPAMLYCNISE